MIESTSQHHSSNFIDAAGDKLETFLHSAAYSAVQEPANGMFQISDKILKTNIVAHTQLIAKPKEADFNTGDWYAQQAGNAVGMAVDFWTLSKLHTKASSVARAETVFVSDKTLVRRATIDGAVYNGVFRPVDDAKTGFYSQRLANSLSGAATFATLSVAAQGVKGLGANTNIAFGNLLSHDVVAGLIASAPAGFVSAEAGSILSGHGTASAPDIGKSIYSFAIGGTILGAMHTFARPIDPTVSSVPTTAANPELLNAIRDTAQSKVLGGPESVRSGETRRPTSDGDSKKPGSGGSVADPPERGGAGSSETVRTSARVAASDQAGAIRDTVQEQMFGRPVAAGKSEVNVAAPRLPDVFAMYDQQNYRWVPVRSLIVDIRTARGPSMVRSLGKSLIVSDPAGKVNHLRFSPEATDIEKTNLVMAAGYARLAETDALAFDAAKRSTLLGRLGLSSKQTVMNQAIKGSQRYVSGERPDHLYTAYLERRFGPLTEENAAWGQHIISDPTSPESGFNSAIAPATETLFSMGLPVTAAYRAAASNPEVLRMPPWQRGSAIRGVAAYANSVADRMSGPATPPVVRDALVGKLAPYITPSEVNAAAAIFSEDPSPSRYPYVVQATDSLVASGRFTDARAAYRALKTTTDAIQAATVGETPDAQPVNDAHVVHLSEQFLAAARAAGVTEQQLQNREFVRLAFDVYAADDSALPLVADALRIMGPTATVNQVRAINTMRENGVDLSTLHFLDVEAAAELM